MSRRKERETILSTLQAVMASVPKHKPCGYCRGLVAEQEAYYNADMHRVCAQQRARDLGERVTA